MRFVLIKVMDGFDVYITGRDDLSLPACWH